jgi:hypothetical protein
MDVTILGVKVSILLEDFAGFASVCRGFPPWIYTADFDLF